MSYLFFGGIKGERLLNFRFLKRFKKAPRYFVIKEGVVEVRIENESVCYVQACGNYMKIYCESSRHIVRARIRDFEHMVPDPQAYARIHRSYWVRTEKVCQKSNKKVVVGNQSISVGGKYLANLDRIKFCR